MVTGGEKGTYSGGNTENLYEAGRPWALIQHLCNPGDSLDERKLLPSSSPTVGSLINGPITRTAVSPLQKSCRLAGPIDRRAANAARPRQTVAHRRQWRFA